MAQTSISATVRVAWWVKPYLLFWCAASWLGINVDLARVGRKTADGITMKFGDRTERLSDKLYFEAERAGR